MGSIELSSGWLAMSKAPMDGTIILVTETANGESFQVLPAAFMNHGGGIPQFGEKKIGSIGWWAVVPSRLTGQGGNCPLPVTWRPLASTPVCWMPMPEMESIEKLQNRLRYVMSKRGKARKESLVAELTASA